jgi:hypothetical protein
MCDPVGVHGTVARHIVHHRGVHEDACNWIGIPASEVVARLDWISWGDEVLKVWPGASAACGESVTRVSIHWVDTRVCAIQAYETDAPAILIGEVQPGSNYHDARGNSHVASCDELTFDFRTI